MYKPQCLLRLKLKGENRATRSEKTGRKDRLPGISERIYTKTEKKVSKKSRKFLSVE